MPYVKLPLNRLLSTVLDDVIVALRLSRGLHQRICRETGCKRRTLACMCSDPTFKSRFEDVQRLDDWFTRYGGQSGGFSGIYKSVSINAKLKSDALAEAQASRQLDVVTHIEKLGSDGKTTSAI